MAGRAAAAAASTAGSSTRGLPHRPVRPARLRTIAPHVAQCRVRSTPTPPGIWSPTSSGCAIHLGIDSWLVFGGSWGSTLALAYAQTPSRPRQRTGAARHLHCCAAGSSTGTTSGGAATSSPTSGSASWRRSRSTSAADLIAAYRDLLADPDHRAPPPRVAWSLWEGETITLLPQPERVAEFGERRFALAFARIENHYFVHGGCLDDGQLLRDVAAIADIPGVDRAGPLRRASARR